MFVSEELVAEFCLKKFVRRIAFESLKVCRRIEKLLKVFTRRRWKFSRRILFVSFETFWKFNSSSPKVPSASFKNLKFVKIGCRISRKSLKVSLVFPKNWLKNFVGKLKIFTHRHKFWRRIPSTKFWKVWKFLSATTESLKKSTE